MTLMVPFYSTLPSKPYRSHNVASFGDPFGNISEALSPCCALFFRLVRPPHRPQADARGAKVLGLLQGFEGP